MATWPRFVCIREVYGGGHSEEAWLTVLRVEDGCHMARFWPYGLGREKAKAMAEALCDELNAADTPLGG